MKTQKIERSLAIILLASLLLLSGCEFGIAPAWKQADDAKPKLSVQFAQLQQNSSGARAIIQGSGTLYIRIIGGSSELKSPLLGPFTVEGGKEFTTTELPAGTYASLMILYFGSGVDTSAKYTYDSKEYSFTDLLSMPDPSFQAMTAGTSGAKQQLDATLNGKASQGEAKNVELKKGEVTNLTLTLKPIVTDANRVTLGTAQETTLSSPTATKVFYGLNDVFFDADKIGSVTCTITGGTVGQAALYTSNGELVSSPGTTAGTYNVNRSSVVSLLGTNMSTSMYLYLDFTGNVTVTFTRNYASKTQASAESTALLQEGITALKAKDFDLAYTKFTASYAADPVNTDAIFWCALLNLASITSDPATVTLMKDRIGIADYPSTMNSLFSDTWFNTTYYGTYREFHPATAEELSDTTYYFIRGKLVPDTDYANGYDYCYAYYQTARNGYSGHSLMTFIPDNTGDYYTDYYTVNNVYYSGYYGNMPSSATKYRMGDTINLADTQLLPRLEIPAWASSYLGLDVYGENSSHIANQSFSMLLMFNLITKNPQGLNSMIDSILAGPFGSKLNKAITLIDNLPDSATITIPPELIAAYNSDGTMPTKSTVVRKAELKAFSGSVQLTRSLVQLLASYNLNYPLAFLQNNFWSTSGNQTMMDKLMTQQNPIAAGFLTTRNATIRDSAKGSFVTGLAEISDATDLLTAELNDAASLASDSLSYMDDMTVADAITQLANVKTMIGILRSSILSGTTIYMNPDSTTVDTILSTTPGSTFYAFKPAVAFNTDLLNPAKLFAINGTDAAPTGIKLYGMNYDGSGNEAFTELTKPADILAAPFYDGVYGKMKISRINELYTPLPGEINDDGAGYTYIEFAGGSPKQLSDLEWNLIQWMK